MVHRSLILKGLIKSLKALSVAAAILLGGCAGSSLFISYPQQVKPLIERINNDIPANLAVCSECKGRDRVLYNMERGRVSQIVGQRDLSMRYFKAAIDEVQKNEQRALLRASSFGATAAAVAINDNAIPYEGDGYEKVMLYHYQGMNYLANSDIEGAGVEFRRANREQNELLERFEKEIERAREESARQKSPGSAEALEARYAQMDEVAGKVKNSFQNAYSFFLSGLVYELLRQPNDAYIDYKKALEIFPENTYLQKDVVRLAAKLGMREDLDELARRFNLDHRELARKQEGTGEVIVIFEDGLVPAKEEAKILMPIPRVGIMALAFPVYEASWSYQTPLQVKTGGLTLGATEAICDFRALAVKSLKEKAMAMTVRQVARAVAKGATSKLAREKGGDMGELLSGVWNILSENADLRSWLTLPSNAQILRATIQAGAHELLLNQYGVAGKADITVPANGKVIVHVIRTSTRFHVNTSTFAAARQAVD